MLRFFFCCCCCCSLFLSFLVSICHDAFSYTSPTLRPHLPCVVREYINIHEYTHILKANVCPFCSFRRFCTSCVSRFASVCLCITHSHLLPVARCGSFVRLSFRSPFYHLFTCVQFSTTTLFSQPLVLVLLMLLLLLMSFGGRKRQHSR